MYLDFLVKIPNQSNKITYRKTDKAEYVYYEYKRIYKKGSNITNPKRVTIGKRDKNDSSMMWPNENYLKYFPDEEIPETSERTRRSSSLRIGAWLVIRKIIEDYGFSEILEKYINQRDLKMVLDLVAYTIISEDNAGQYYPDYAYDHPLFTEKMHIYSDSKVSDLLQSMTVDMSVGFLNDWNEKRDHREKIYISYDSTNKNCQAGDIEIVEYGHAKVDTGTPIFNYAVAYDTTNREPLFYEEYPGSINDVSQLEFMLNRTAAYGYKKIGFILDRGYFSRNNLMLMDQHGYSFIIMLKGLNPLVHAMITEKKGSFENDWDKHIDEFDVYGMTIKRKMYEGDDRERYFHLFHSSSKEGNERALLSKKLRQMKAHMKKHENETVRFGSGFEKYFTLYYNEENGRFQFASYRKDVIEMENSLSGYFCIVTSENMTAKEALLKYKNRDASEKLFRGDKSYLGDRSLRVYGDSSAESKIFIEFLALIVRNKIYNCLKDEWIRLEKRPNYMTVPAALNELEKIELSRFADNQYRLDHAVTATQKTILKAFGLDADYIKKHAAELSSILKEAH